MSDTDPTPELFTLDAIAKSISDFEALLRIKQKQLPAGSSIEAAGLAALEMLEVYNGNVKSNPSQDHRNEWREAVALADMLRKVLSVDGHPCFAELWPHLLLLLGKSNIALNVWNPSIDADANKVFELYMALILARLTSSVELDHPKHSSGGKNPDVIAELDGSSWAFACKVMHSKSPKSLLDRVRDGIDQIEACNAKHGIVVISLKNLIPHEAFWESMPKSDIWDLLVARPSQSVIGATMLQEWCATAQQQILKVFTDPEKDFRALFTGKKAIPAVLLHLCTTVSASVDDKPSFHFLRMFGTLNVDPLTEEVLAILEKLNRSLHNRSVSPLVSTEM